MAYASKQSRERDAGESFSTEILPFVEFTLAENYHQKYYLKQNQTLYMDLRRIYPDPMDLINSTGAARINGFLLGYGEDTYFNQVIGELGLSIESQLILTNRFK